MRFSSVPVGRVRRPDNHPGKGPPPKPVLVAERPCWTPSENIPASVISGNAGGELFCLERSGNSSNTGSNTTPTVTNPTSYTFNGSGWGHSVGMSQWGAYAMAQKGFTYDQILKFYFTGIEIAE